MTSRLGRRLTAYARSSVYWQTAAAIWLGAGISALLEADYLLGVVDLVASFVTLLWSRVFKYMRDQVQLNQEALTLTNIGAHAAATALQKCLAAGDYTQAAEVADQQQHIAEVYLRMNVPEPSGNSPW